MEKNKINIIVFAIIVIASFVSISFTDIPEKLKNIGSKKLYKSVISNYLNYNSLSIKSGIKVEINNKKYSLKGNFRITKDSIIWVNLNHASGIAVLRAVITPDSIKYVDKINKKYHADLYNNIIKELKVNLDYKSLQAMLTNELFSVSDDRKEIRTFSDYDSSIDSNMYLFQNFKDRKVRKFYRTNKFDLFVLEKIYIQPCSFKIKCFNIEDLVSGKKLNISYDDFEKIDSTMFPNIITLDVIDDTLKTSLTMKHSKIKINPINDYTFKIPKFNSAEEENIEE